MAQLCDLRPTAAQPDGSTLRRLERVVGSICKAPSTPNSPREGGWVVFGRKDPRGAAPFVARLKASAEATNADVAEGKEECWTFECGGPNRLCEWQKHS